MVVSSGNVEPEQLLSWVVPKWSNGRTLFVVLLIGLGFYVGTFVLVAPLDYGLKLIAPHLPWLAHPYVDPDPPALQVAIKCANLVGGFWLVCGVLVLLANQIDETIVIRQDHLSCRMLKLNRKFPFASLSNVRIGPCFGEGWRLRFTQVRAGQIVRSIAYGIPADMPVDKLIDLFRSKGFEVATSTT